MVVQLKNEPAHHSGSEWCLAVIRTLLRAGSSRCSPGALPSNFSTHLTRAFAQTR
ncbi:hypothetical protein YC2023_114515 [Brassica napus]